MRVESPQKDVALISEVALAVLRLNHHLEEALFSGDENPLIPLPLIEVYQPGELRKDQFKLPAFVDESHLAAIEGSAKQSLKEAETTGTFFAHVAGVLVAGRKQERRKK
jgi:hypothetical protein